MSKKVRQLVIFLVVLVILGGGALALTMLNKQGSGTGDTSSTGTSSGETLANLIDKKDQFASVVITNETGSYKLYAETKDDATSYIVEGYEGLSLVNLVSSTIVTNCTDVTPNRELGKVDNLAEYGLDKPQATLKIAYKDGSNITMLIGNKTVSETSSYYVKLEDKDEVYIVGLSSYLFSDKTDHLDVAVLNEKKTDEDGNEVASVFGRVTLSGKNFPETLVIDQYQGKGDADPLNMSTYIISKPEIMPLTTSFSEDIGTYLVTLTAEKAVVGNPTQEELEKYGFADPQAVVDYILDDKEYKLIAGNTEGDYTYFMKDGSNIIYQTKTTDLPWVTTSKLKLRNSLVFLVSVNSVERIKVTTADGTYVFEHTRKLNEEKTSSNGKDTYDYTTYYNGTELNADYFSKFYQVLIGISKERFVEEGDKPAGEAGVKIELEYYDEFDTENTVIELFDLGERRALYRLDGKDTMVIKNSWISKITEDVQKIIKNQQVNAL